MKIVTYSDTLRVTDLCELDEDRTDELIHHIATALPPSVRVIEFDFSKLRAIDSAGARVLMAIHTALGRTGAAFAWRVLNPPPAVRQLLELVRLHRLFEIVPPRIRGAAAS